MRLLFLLTAFLICSDYVFAVSLGLQVSKTILLQSSVSLDPSNPYVILEGETVVLDGQQNFIFCHNSKYPLFILKSNSNLILRNITINNFDTNNFIVGEGASIFFGQDCNIVLRKDITLSANNYCLNIAGELRVSGAKNVIELLTQNCINLIGEAKISFHGCELRLNDYSVFKMNPAAVLAFEDSVLKLGVDSYFLDQGCIEVKGNLLIVNGSGVVDNLKLEILNNFCIKVLPSSIVKIPFNLTVVIKSSEVKIIFDDPLTSGFELVGCKWIFETSSFCLDAGIFFIKDLVNFSSEQKMTLDINNQSLFKLMHSARFLTNVNMRYGC